jgi:sugar lactone lactonase YvrE
MASRRHRSLLSLTAAIAAALAGLCVTASARAMEPCPAPPKVNVLSDGHGTLESVGVDRRGRLFFTDSGSGELLMLKHPGAEPKVIADGIDGPGGIVFQRRQGNVLVGFGNTMDQAVDGTLSPDGGLLRVDPKTKASEIRTEGLQAANGIARGPEHAIFASNAMVPGGIDRVERGEMPQLNWGTVISPNGMIADSARDSLFVNQTLTLSSIQRVPFDDPSAATTYFQAAPADAAGGLDGLTRGDGNTLFAAANGSGEVWRVDGPGDACAVLTRDPFPLGPSDVAFGKPGTGFSPENLYVTTFGGELLELVGARG